MFPQRAIACGRRDAIGRPTRARSTNDTRSTNGAFVSVVRALFHFMFYFIHFMLYLCFISSTVCFISLHARVVGWDISLDVDVAERRAMGVTTSTSSVTLSSSPSLYDIQ